MEVKWEDRGKIALETFEISRKMFITDWSKLDNYNKKQWNKVYDSCKNSTILECGNGEKLIVKDDKHG